jgi:hypothetical protein
MVSRKRQKRGQATSNDETKTARGKSAAASPLGATERATDGWMDGWMDGRMIASQPTEKNHS